MKTRASLLFCWSLSAFSISTIRPSGRNRKSMKLLRSGSPPPTWVNVTVSIFSPVPASIDWAPAETATTNDDSNKAFFIGISSQECRFGDGARPVDPTLRHDMPL